MGLSALSLFSGGGGLDLGMEDAGFEHVASYDFDPICGDTLRLNRPDWSVFSGPGEGDVRGIDWTWADGVDLLHGGPPCQPFAVSGEHLGEDDERDMWPEFTRAVLEARPRMFLAENVPGLLRGRFDSYLRRILIEFRKGGYRVQASVIRAQDFGVPQHRPRVMVVGFRDKRDREGWRWPSPTHHVGPGTDFFGRPRTKLAREALDMDPLPADRLAPALTRRVYGGSQGQRIWKRVLLIWPDELRITREDARAAEHHSGLDLLSLEDLAVLQGFPPDWRFAGRKTKVVGQIGNSVSPKVALAMGRAAARALS